MKKITTLLLLITLISNTSFANTIPKLDLGNFIMEEEFPDSNLVEPILPKEEENIIIEGSVEATPEIGQEEAAFALEDCYKSVPNPKIVVLCGACAISGGVFEKSSKLNRDFLESKAPLHNKQ